VFLRKRLFVAALALLALFGAYRAAYRVPILMYHVVGDPAEYGGLGVRPATFERQMEFLRAHGYHVIGLEELVRLVREGRRAPLGTVVITFDDGTIDNIDKAFPVLKKMGFPATVFMITSNIDREGWLSAEDLRLMDASEITIGSHTVSHAYLPDLRSEEDVVREIRQSKRTLEDLLGHPVTLFSYPAGGFTGSIRSIVAAEGYEGAVTTNQGLAANDPYALHRVKVRDSAGNLFNFWAKTTGLYHIGKKRIVTE